MQCASKRSHPPHRFMAPDGFGTRYCEGRDEDEVDPVAETASGRGLGRLFERKQQEEK